MLRNFGVLGLFFVLELLVHMLLVLCFTCLDLLYLLMLRFVWTVVLLVFECPSGWVRVVFFGFWISALEFWVLSCWGFLGFSDLCSRVC